MISQALDPEDMGNASGRGLCWGHLPLGHSLSTSIWTEKSGDTEPLSPPRDLEWKGRAGWVGVGTHGKKGISKNLSYGMGSLRGQPVLLTAGPGMVWGTGFCPKGGVLMILLWTT